MSDVYQVPPQPVHHGLPDRHRDPDAIVLGTIGGYSISWANELAASRRSPRAAGLLFIPPLLMIVFRQKYPR